MKYRWIVTEFRRRVSLRCTGETYYRFAYQRYWK